MIKYSNYGERGNPFTAKEYDLDGRFLRKFEKNPRNGEWRLVKSKERNIKKRRFRFPANRNVEKLNKKIDKLSLKLSKIEEPPRINHN